MAWSKSKHFHDEVSFSVAIESAFPELLDITGAAIQSAAQQGQRLIESRTPVKTGRLKSSWNTEDKGLPVEGKTTTVAVTGNDARDPKTGYDYATTVELGLKRKAGPAYMVQGSIEQIVDLLHQEMQKVN